MKKWIIILTVLPFLTIPAINAQNPNMERLNSYKIGFFTKKMNLSSAEAEKFWPAYNDYEKQKKIIQRDKLMLARDFNQNESILTDSQMAEMGDKLIKYMADESALTVAFHRKIKEFLPPGKVLRYYQAENQYKLQLLKELQDNRQQRRINTDPEF
jgi:hypothetical protein